MQHKDFGLAFVFKITCLEFSRRSLVNSVMCSVVWEISTLYSFHQHFNLPFHKKKNSITTKGKSKPQVDHLYFCPNLMYSRLGILPCHSENSCLMQADMSIDKEKAEVIAGLPLELALSFQLFSHAEAQPHREHGRGSPDGG